MIKGGYILQPRVVDESEVAQFPPVTRELWHYLLRKVNHARNDRLNIDRGQGFVTLSDIQDDLKWYSGYRKNTYSKPQLTKSLRRLRESTMIVTAKETRGILVTVCNYDYYQDPKNYEGNYEGNTKETRKKRKGLTINKNVKNEKNENKTTTPFRALDFLVLEGVEKQNASDWLKVRSKKRLANTESSFNKIFEQIKKKGLTIQEGIKICAEESWGGFKATWELPGRYKGQVSEGSCENCTGSFGDCPWRTKDNVPPPGKKCFNQIERKR